MKYSSSQNHAKPEHCRPIKRKIIYALLIIASILFGEGCFSIRNGMEHGRLDGSIFPVTVGSSARRRRIKAFSSEEIYRRIQAEGSTTLFNYDFREGYLAEYSLPEGEEIILSLENLVTGSELESFGLFNFWRLSMIPGRAIGRTGHLSDGLLAFYNGRQAFRISSLGNRSVKETDLLLLYEKLIERLGGQGDVPKELTALTSLNIPSPDISYEPVSILGSNRLAPGLIARLAPSSEARVFISTKKSEEEAQSAFRGYVTIMAGGPRGASFILGVGQTACRLWDDQRGWINLSRMGRYIIGVAGPESADGGWVIITRILSGLPA